MISFKKLRLPLTLSKSLLGVIFCAPAYLLAETNLYLGNLHSNFLLDACAVRNSKMTPATAYRFAFGIPNSCNRYA